MRAHLDVARIKRRLPDPRARRCTASGSCTSTPRRRRRSRSAVLDAMDELLPRPTTPTSTAACTRSPRRRTARVRGGPRQGRALRRRRARPTEIVFTRNATEAINLVAYSWARAQPRARATSIVLSEMEHHANIVPWHMLAAERGVELRWIPLTADYRLDLTDLDALLAGAKLLAITAMSNVLGTINDIRPLADAAHAAGAHVLVDAAPGRAAPRGRRAGLGRRLRRRHRRTRCSARPASARSGPARELLEAMPPFLGGGEMIRDVRKDGFTTNERARGSSRPARRRSPRPSASARRSTTSRRSAWTRSASTRCELTAVRARRARATASATGSRSTARPTSRSRGGAISFLFDGIHAHDISQVLDEDAVCVRAGHHCAKPLMRVLGVPATTRASFYVYNDEADADALVEALVAGREVLRPLRIRRHRCPDSKTSTARSSSTTTARRGTAASSPTPPAHKSEGFNPLCGDEVVLYLDVDGRHGHRREDRRPGLLDQPGVHVDDERGGEGQVGRRGPPAHPRVQGAHVDPRVEARGRGRRRRPRAPSSTACASATSRRCRAS